MIFLHKIATFFRVSLAGSIGARNTLMVLLAIAIVPITEADPWYCDPRQGIPAVVAGEVGGKAFGSPFGNVGGEAAERGLGVFGPFPSLDSIFRNCVADPLGGPPLPPPDDPWDVVAGWPDDAGDAWDVFSDFWGDIHLKTRDGLRYSYQAAGDHVIAQGDGFEIQMRMVRPYLGSGASLPAALAVKIDDAVIVIGPPDYTNASEDSITFNGEPMTVGNFGWVDLPRGGYVHRVGGLWRVAIPELVSIAIDEDMSPLRVAFASSIAETVDGLIGNRDNDPSNDLQLADGTAVDPDDFDTLYGPFLQRWWRNAASSLFAKTYDEAQWGAVVPSTRLDLDDYDPALRQIATQQCLDHDTPAGAGLAECTLDLLVTENLDFAEDAATVAGGLAGSISGDVIGTFTETTDLTMLELGDSVAPGIPVAAAGMLANSDSFHSYGLPDVASQTRFLRVDLPCSELQPVAISWLQSDRLLAGDQLACGGLLTIPTGAEQLLVHNELGLPVEYAFTLVAEPYIDQGTLPLDSLVSGTMAMAGWYRWTIPASTGSTYYIDAGEPTSCSHIWRVTDAAEQTLEATLQCADIGRVTFEGPGPWYLWLENGSRLQGDESDADYEFQLTLVEEQTPVTVDEDPASEFLLEIVSPGVTASAVFTAIEGERLFFRSTQDLLGTWELYDPNGNLVADWFTSFNQFVVAPLAGEYTLTLIPNGDTVGGSTMTLYRVPEDPLTDVELGDSVELQVEVPGQRPAVRVSLLAGQRVYLDRDSVRGGLLTVSNETGDLIAATTQSQADLMFTAPAEGLFTIQLDYEAAGFNPETANYPMTLYAVADDTEINVSRGDSFTLTLSTPGQIASAFFDMSEGESLSITTTGSSADKRLRLLRPDGSVEIPLITASRTFSAQQTGTYQLELQTNGGGFGTLEVELN